MNPALPEMRAAQICVAADRKFFPATTRYLPDPRGGRRVTDRMAEVLTPSEALCNRGGEPGSPSMRWERPWLCCRRSNACSSGSFVSTGTPTRTADMTGTPIGTIMSRLARARRELHAHLGGNARERWCAFRHPNRGAAHERHS